MTARSGLRVVPPVGERAIWCSGCSRLSKLGLWPMVEVEACDRCSRLTWPLVVRTALVLCALLFALWVMGSSEPLRPTGESPWPAPSENQ